MQTSNLTPQKTPYFTDVEREHVRVDRIRERFTNHTSYQKRHIKSRHTSQTSIQRPVQYDLKDKPSQKKTKSPKKLH